MTDSELAAWLGIEAERDWQVIIDRLPLARRISYERMAHIENELTEWLEGRAPKPECVLLDFPRRPFT